MASATFTVNIAASTFNSRLHVGPATCVHGSLETSVSYSSADTVLLKKIQAGEVIDDIRIISMGHPAGAQLKVNIGDSVDPDRYADSLSMLPDLVYHGMREPAGFNYTYTADDILRLTFDTAASLTATSTLKFVITSHRA